MSTAGVNPHSSHNSFNWPRTSGGKYKTAGCREITRKLSFPSACGIWIARIVAIVSFPTKIALVKSSSLSLVSSASMRAFFAAQTEAPSGGIGFSQLTVDSDPELG